MIKSNNDLNKVKRQSILTSYLIGTPIGLITIFVCFALPSAISGEGLPTMGLVAIYGKAIIGLILSFLFSLWFAAKNIYKHIDNESLLKTSFRYSQTVNLIIWTIFILITILDNLSNLYAEFLIPPIIAFVICTIVSTFTVGLLIVYKIEQKIKIIKIDQ